ncbi:DUF2254 domain-containing protein [Aliihoeflea sp. PC F10.4]
MTSKTLWRLRRIIRQLWFRATLISLLAVAAALIAFFVTPYLPPDLSARIGAEAADNILSIIASSMLAVTTFSLSTMITAYGAATSNVTPRATKLIMEDSTTQNVLATFVGSFLYSLVAIITLSMGAYGERGRVVLFVVTIFVVILIVVTLLRWIDYLMRLGRVGETTQRVESAALRAMKDRRDEPFLGGRPLRGHNEIPADGRQIMAPTIGYVDHIDVASINKAAKECGGVVYLLALPGTFVDPGRALAMATGGDEALDDAVVNAFTIGSERSFDQDPRFGVIVLSEIGQRALSQAINDPGTAIDVIGRSVRVLSIWGDETKNDDPRYPHVQVPPISLDEIFDDFFQPIARDGAGLSEVQVRLQKALAALSRLPDPRFAKAAKRHSKLALARVRHAMQLEEDIAPVEEAAKKVRGGDQEGNGIELAERSAIL